MIPPIQQTLVERLARICELTPDIRFGQMMAMMSVLAEAFSDQSVWDVEDETLLTVLDQHLEDLVARGNTSQLALPPDSDKAVAARPVMPMLNS